MPASNDPSPKPMNAFQLLGALLAAAVGIRGPEERGRDWSKVRTRTVFAAILIFISAGYLAIRIFVQLVQNFVGQ